MTRTLEAYADDRAHARFVENQEIARQNRTLRAEVREQAAALAEARKLLGVYEVVNKARLAPPKWAAPKQSDAKHRGVLCFALSDIHWGAVVRAEEINGINAYDLAIAERRLRYTFESVIKIARSYFAGVEYDGLQLFLPGDMHSGEIHAELRETNAVGIADSITSLLEPMEAGINMLAQEFGKVNIACVVGNHTRRTRKPLSKRRVIDNYDYLTYRLLAREYNKHARVAVTVSPSADERVQVYDTRYVLTHGDQFRGGGGISAEMAPLLLGVHRKMRRDAVTGHPFDIMVMGHFHRTLFLPTNGLIVCGSVMGYDEFAFLSNFRPERPQSMLWITTPENGVTLSSPVYAARRGEEAK